MRRCSPTQNPKRCRSLVPALRAQDRKLAGSCRPWSATTPIITIPLDEVLKGELKAYADDLKSVLRSSRPAPTRRNLRSGSMSTYSASKTVALAQSAERGSGDRGTTAVAAGCAFRRAAPACLASLAWVAIRPCPACGGRISATGRVRTQLAIAAFVIVAAECFLGDGGRQPARAVQCRPAAACAVARWRRRCS